MPSASPLQNVDNEVLPPLAWSGWGATTPNPRLSTAATDNASEKRRKRDMGPSSYVT